MELTQVTAGAMRRHRGEALPAARATLTIAPPSLVAIRSRDEAAGHEPPAEAGPVRRRAARPLRPMVSLVDAVKARRVTPIALACWRGWTGANVAGIPAGSPWRSEKFQAIATGADGARGARAGSGP